MVVLNNNCIFQRWRWLLIENKATSKIKYMYDPKPPHTNLDCINFQSSMHRIQPNRIVFKNTHAYTKIIWNFQFSSKLWYRSNSNTNRLVFKTLLGRYSRQPQIPAIVWVLNTGPKWLVFEAPIPWLRSVFGRYLKHLDHTSNPRYRPFLAGRYSRIACNDRKVFEVQ